MWLLAAKFIRQKIHRGNLEKITFGSIILASLEVLNISASGRDNLEKEPSSGQTKHAHLYM